LELIEFAINQGKQPDKWSAKREAVYEKVKQLDKRLKDKKHQLTFDEEIKVAIEIVNRGLEKHLNR
jgi:predicted DNA-binding protein YlxM (UPF0122 family)